MRSPYADAPINALLTAEEKIDLFRQMVRARSFEKGAMRWYNAGKMGGFLSLQTGQEAIAVGVRSLLCADDHVFSGFRAIGHGLAAGMTMNACMAELFGKATGCVKGKGGMMGMFAPAGNFWGGYSVAGAQTPLAAGMAFALKLRDIRGVVCCFLGDGAVNQGCFHEALNLAGLFDLPVIYIIENNRYGMGTSVDRASAYRDCLAKRAEGYDIAWDLIQGEDVYQIRAKVWKAICRAREELKPTVLEISTYRYYGHTVADSQTRRYRTPEEIEDQKLHRDPIVRWMGELMSEGVLDETVSSAILEVAKREVKAATEFAEASPAPTVPDISRDVYWESDHDTDASRVGWHFFDS